MARPRQVSDAQIEEAARAAFLEHGPSVSLARIAERLGISAPALLKRVGSKDELLLAAMAPDGAAPFDALLRDGPVAARAVDAQLVEILVAMTAFLRETMPRLLTLRAGGTPVPAMLGEARGPAPVRRDLAAWLRRAERAGLARVPDPAAMADLLVGVVEARCVMEHLMARRRRGDRRWAERTVRALWGGIDPE